MFNNDLLCCVLHICYAVQVLCHPEFIQDKYFYSIRDQKITDFTWEKNTVVYFTIYYRKL